MRRVVDIMPPLPDRAQRSLTPDDVRVTRRQPISRLLSWLLVGLIVWLPLQTPVAIALYQYTQLPVDMVRALVLAKDAVVAGIILLLLLTEGRRLPWTWLDRLPVAYAAIVVVYAVVPLLLPDRPSLNATAAGFRQYILPVELYGLGRLAAHAGVPWGRVLKVFLIVALASAVFTTGLYLFLPVTFWESTLDLVGFVREVQGLAYAQSLWWISVVMNYGTQGEVARAIGPFTHPVGTASYFVLPLTIAFSALCIAQTQRRSSRLIWAGASLLFSAAIVFTISRAGWFAVALAFVTGGGLLRQRRLGFFGVVLLAAVVWFVPPFSLSVHSAISGADGSAIMHQQAVQNGFELVRQNPLGMGVGRADAPFASTFDQDREEGTLLESTYLSLFIGTGPLGLATFVFWIASIVAALWPGRLFLRAHWPQLAMITAIIGLAVASLTSATTLRFTTAASFWILLGLIVGHLPRARLRLVRGGQAGSSSEPHRA